MKKPRIKAQCSNKMEPLKQFNYVGKRSGIMLLLLTLDVGENFRQIVKEGDGIF